MDLAGKYLVVWLSPEGIETFLGVPVPTDESALTTWTVAGQVVGEAGPGPVGAVTRVILPSGDVTARFTRAFGLARSRVCASR